MILDRERPRVRESGATAQADVLNREEKLPERRDLREFAQGWQKEVDREDDEVGGHDAQSAAREEAAELDGAGARELRQELATNEVAAEDEEQVDADPAEAVRLAGKRETENAGVINDDDDDRECAEEVESRLPLALGEARIDGYFAQGNIDGRLRD